MRGPTSAAHLVACASAVWVLAGAPGAAQAQGYDYDVTELELTGASPFFDDFADGERSLPPTSSLQDILGTTTEGVGSLRLTDADGAAPTSFPNGATGGNNVALLTSTGFFDGAGPASFITTWSGPLPTLSGDEYTDAFGEVLFFFPEPVDPGPQTFSLSVTASGFLGTLPFVECQHADPQVAMLYTEPFLTIAACDPIDPGDVTGPIVLRLDFDDAGNAFSFAYSLDGGASFKPSSSWALPIASLPVASMQAGSALPGVSASATALPPVQLPGPGIVTGIALLAAALTSGALRAPRSQEQA